MRTKKSNIIIKKIDDETYEIRINSHDGIAVTRNDGASWELSPNIRKYGLLIHEQLREFLEKQD